MTQDNDDRVKRFFETFADAQRAVEVTTANVLLVQWARKGIGFGEITMVVDADGLRIDSEHMSARFVKDVLCALIDAAEASGRLR